VVNTPDDDSEFERRSKALFDRSVEQLDARTRARLARARAAAISEAEPQPKQRRWRVVAPVVGVAAASVATLAVVLDRRSTPRRATPPLEDLDLLASGDIDLLQQDLAFYAWLDEQPEFQGDA
jgi:hypothetical protein